MSTLAGTRDAQCEELYPSRARHLCAADDSVRILGKRESKEEPISFMPDEMENLVKETSARF